MTLTKLRECPAFLYPPPADRGAALRDRHAADRPEPVYLIGAHSFWTPVVTRKTRDQGFDLFPRRECLEENQHEDVEWTCADCEGTGLEDGSEGTLWAMVRKGLRRASDEVLDAQKERRMWRGGKLEEEREKARARK